MSKIAVNFQENPDNSGNNQITTKNYRRYEHYSIDELLDERNALIKSNLYHSDIDLELFRRNSSKH